MPDTEHNGYNIDTPGGSIHVGSYRSTNAVCMVLSTPDDGTVAIDLSTDEAIELAVALLRERNLLEVDSG